MILLKYSSLLHSHCLKIVLILLFSLKDYFKICICVSIGTGVQVPAEPLDPSWAGVTGGYEPPSVGMGTNLEPLEELDNNCWAQSVVLNQIFCHVLWSLPLRVSSVQRWVHLRWTITSRFHIEIWWFNVLDFRVHFRRASGRGRVQVLSVSRTHLVVVKARQFPDSADNCGPWSTRVDRPLMPRQMCQKASQSLGENLQVLNEGKSRQTQLQVSPSFPDRG